MADSEKNAQSSSAKAEEDVTASTGAAALEGKEEGWSQPDHAPAQSTQSWLMSLMKRSMKLDGPDDWPEKYLEEVTVDGIVKYIQSDRCKNIVTMAGAGISTSAGIPDFRSPDTGLYDNLQKYNLPNPQSIFDISFFKENPEPFFHLAKELWPGIFKPTPCHYFLRLLAEKGLLRKHFTQNIDTLERVAGLDGDKVIEAHGTFHTSHCVNEECRHEYSQEWIKEKIFAETIPTCEKEGCGSLVKPDIVFFGEQLPAKFFEAVAKDIPECDLLIIMGTSLVVQPFASLTNRVKETAPRLYINLEKASGGSDPLMAMMGMGHGFAFDDENNYRDVFFESTCDDGCMALADKLGWGDELRKMIKTEHKKIDTEIAERKEELKSLKERSPSAAASAASSAKSSKVETDAKSTKDSKQTPSKCDTKQNATLKDKGKL